MIPLYYKGNKYTTQDTVVVALHIGKVRLRTLLEQLAAGEVVYLHGHRVFIDENYLRSIHEEKRAAIKAQYKKEREEKLRLLMGKDYKRGPLLAKGYITHWLGVYHG